MQTTFNGQQFHGHPKFYEFLMQMAEVHSRKNHDYAGDADPLKNLRSAERIGLAPFVGVLVRLQDKWSRLEQFQKSGTLLVKDESVIDTLIDNANYSILAAILLLEAKADEVAPPKEAETPPRSCLECGHQVSSGGTCLCVGVADNCFKERV